MNQLNKLLRFLWRTSRNSLCLVPVTRQILFSQDCLAARFGRGDAEYAWGVFIRHFNRLKGAGFTSAGRILEVGPGRNLGTALLWWAYCGAKRENPVEVMCWDVFKNVSPEIADFWVNLARELLDAQPAGALQESEIDHMQARLREVAEWRLQPQITYRVEPLRELEGAMVANGVQFELIYSQAAIEHIWHIEAFWDLIGRITAPGGWHSHRIDLADHGSRETNYIEMLEWSRLGYWLTMRFVPGAPNRWRAVHHFTMLESLGMRLVDVSREMRDRLPVAISKVSSEFRQLGEEELRTTALDVVAIRLTT